MVFVRSSPDPLVRIAIFVVAIIVSLIWKALRKMLPDEASLPQSAKSFRFSEITPGPNDLCVRTIRTKIRGVSCKNRDGRSRQHIVRTLCHSGDALLLVREPDNPVDPNAVAVIRISQGTDGPGFREQLGYLSKEIARDLAPIFHEGPVGFGEIIELTGDLTGQGGENVGVDIRVEAYMPAIGPAGSESASAA